MKGKDVGRGLRLSHSLSTLERLCSSVVAAAGTRHETDISRAYGLVFFTSKSIPQQKGGMLPHQVLRDRGSVPWGGSRPRLQPDRFVTARSVNMSRE